MAGASMFARILLVLIALYRRALSPWLPPACRFVPSCSVYTKETIRRYGGLRGGWLSLKRLGRCRPFGGHGYDPVP